MSPLKIKNFVKNIRVSVKKYQEYQKHLLPGAEREHRDTLTREPGPRERGGAGGKMNTLGEKY